MDRSLPRIRTYLEAYDVYLGPRPDLLLISDALCIRHIFLFMNMDLYYG